MNSDIVFFILIIFIYEISGNMLVALQQDALSKGAFQLSRLQNKLFKDDTALSFTVSSFILVLRLNGVIFLIYFGYKVNWFFAIGTWILSLLASVKVSEFLNQKLRAGLHFPALLSFVTCPIIALILWTMIQYH